MNFLELSKIKCGDIRFDFRAPGTFTRKSRTSMYGVPYTLRTNSRF